MKIYDREYTEIELVTKGIRWKMIQEMIAFFVMIICISIATILYIFGTKGFYAVNTKYYKEGWRFATFILLGVVITLFGIFFCYFRWIQVEGKDSLYEAINIYLKQGKEIYESPNVKFSNNSKVYHKCSRCGHMNDENAMYCSSCGKSFYDDDQNIKESTENDSNNNSSDTNINNSNDEINDDNQNIIINENLEDIVILDDLDNTESINDDEILDNTTINEEIEDEKKPE